MKKIFTFFVAAAVFLSSTFCQVKELKFNADKIDIGNKYSYHIKEIDGSKQMDFHFYVKDSDTLLAYIDFSTVAPMVFIGEFTFDYNTSSFKHTYAYNPFAYMKVPGTNESSEAIYDSQKKNISMIVKYFNNSKKLKEMSGSKDLSIIPCYELSLYQLDLWFALRNYQGNYEDFEVGRIYNAKPGVSVVKYVGSEIMNGVNCEKWEIAEKGLFGKLSKEKQTIWLDLTDKYKKIVKYTNTENIQPVGKLEINFVERTAMSLEDWENFVSGKNEEARVRLGFSKQ